ncbi:hypothetical protein NPIL_451371 [Nephila pilipes]|uniref:Uncharacterized protein n=1 Tax=Nephila pilipes TaxID=299642 RepID=A0A8X6PP91_NEPPI|nr:hypothetical protein NPIL_451371 [Nephila pilipes]
MEDKVASMLLKDNLEVSADIDLDVSEVMKATNNNYTLLKEKEIIRQPENFGEGLTIVNTAGELNELKRAQDDEKVTTEPSGQGQEKPHLTEIKSEEEEEKSKRIFKVIENSPQKFITEESENEPITAIEDQETASNYPTLGAHSTNLVLEEVIDMENAENEALQVTETQETRGNQIFSGDTESITNFEERSDCQEHLRWSFLNMGNSDKIQKNACSFFRYFLGISILIIIVVIIIKFCYALKRDFSYHERSEMTDKEYQEQHQQVEIQPDDSDGHAFSDGSALAVTPRDSTWQYRISQELTIYTIDLPQGRKQTVQSHPRSAKRKLPYQRTGIEAYKRK